MKKKHVYIASPYTLGNKLRNTHRQIYVADVLANHNFIPFWPLSSHYWDELHPHNYEFWMEQDYAWIEKCDCLLRLEGESKGADLEVAHAEECGVLVFYSINDLLNWAVENG